MEIKGSYSQIIFSGKLSLDCSLRTSTISLVPSLLLLKLIWLLGLFMALSSL